VRIGEFPKWVTEERRSVVYMTRLRPHPLRRRRRTLTALRGGGGGDARRSGAEGARRRRSEGERGETEGRKRGRGSMIPMTPPTLRRMKTNNLGFCLKL